MHRKTKPIDIRGQQAQAAEARAKSFEIEESDYCNFSAPPEEIFEMSFSDRESPLSRFSHFSHIPQPSPLHVQQVVPFSSLDDDSNAPANNQTANLTMKWGDDCHYADEQIVLTPRL